MEEKIDNQKGSNLRWWILLTVIIGTFLGRLDETIVNLALPKIISDFGITVSAASWIATAYILANTAFVPIWGKLGDTIGRKKVYLWGFSIFIFGSVLAGLSWNLPSMISFRIIQIDCQLGGLSDGHGNFGCHFQTRSRSARKRSAFGRLLSPPQ